uniref:Reverse transcriptase Ty1/copia-type domain-containing protein n=2 Tax=Photinus pyralis TaxID=7054 RepID=A0A1Y1MVU2_PHOPY
MEVPDGLELDKGKFVCKLKKSLYGLKQSDRNWYNHVTSIMLSLDFAKCISEPCIFFKKDIIVAVYVDDFLVSGIEEEVLKFKEIIGKIIKLKDLGPVRSFISIQFDRPSKNVITINQSQYIKSILNEYNMSESKGISCPLQVGAHFEVKGEGEIFDRELYQKAIGSLLYNSTCTRPDIANAVCKLSQCNQRSTVRNWRGVQNVLKYLKKTIGYRLTYKKNGVFSCYSDSDWASDKNDAKSITGYVFNFGNGAVIWKSRKQKCVASSSTHAEYIALYESMCEFLWLQSLLRELSEEYLIYGREIVYCDNQGSIAIAENETITERSKHFVVKYNFVRECINNRMIKVEYIPSSENLADLFTKSLSGPKTEMFAKAIGLL